MSFDYRLAKEIYGSAWSVDAISFVQLSAILKNIQNKVALDVPAQKFNAIGVYELKSETRLINYSWQLNNPDSFEGIGIVNLDGVITKNGGISSYGTKQMSKQMIQMSKDSRIKGFIIMTDSGGGATSAVKLMQNAISEVKKAKPVYSWIEDGGMAGSAAYGIISGSTGIYSANGMNIVGSAGTMIQFSGMPNGTVDSDGEKHITLYATKSTAKNKGFEEAINNDNYKIIINDLLDPINEAFLADILANRPALKGSNYDDGHTLFSKEAIGTFIDGIASFDEVVSMVLSSAPKSPGSNLNTNTNSNLKKMNRKELKSDHPELYAEVLALGAKNEQERVASWEAYRTADSKAVSEGIASGKEITPSQAHQFQVLLASKGKLSNLRSDNADDVVVDSTAVVDVDEAPEAKAKEKELKAAFDFQL